MAPKKSIDKSATLQKKPKEKKATIQRIKKEKPKLRVPTVKVKLNNTINKKGNIMPVKKETSKKLSRKQLAAAHKLELANEVAQLQLVKESSKPLITSSTLPTPITIPTPRKREKRGRPKSISSETPDNTTTTSCPTDSEDAFHMTPKKRKYTKKTPLPQPPASAKKKPIIIQKSKATEKKTSAPKKIMKQSKTKVVKTENVKCQKKISESASKLVNTKASISKPTPPKRRAPLRRGKPEQNNLTASKCSASLLAQLQSISPRKECLTAEEPPLSPKKENIEPGAIDSRKTSMTGISELSWTKDISNSSTTTCVTACSTDFVRIDKKIPILKLTDVDHLSRPKIPDSQESDSLSDSESTSSSSSSSSSSSGLTPKTPEPEPDPIADLDSQFLNLSTSSVTPTVSQKSKLKSNENNDASVTNTVLDRLDACMKNFDLEILNWIGYDDDTNVDVKQFQDKVFRVLKEESEVIRHCQQLKRVLSGTDEADNIPNDVNDGLATEENHDNVDNFAVPAISVVNSIGKDNENSEHRTQSKTQNDQEEDCENKFTADHSKSDCSNYDDDDALSLFAESITGMESSKTYSVKHIERSTANKFEEYVPQPLSKEKLVRASKISYVPSKIKGQQTPDTRKIVCEKQRADSTSISKEAEMEKNNVSNAIEIIQIAPNAINIPNNFINQNKNCITNEKKRPCLMASLYKSLYGIKSVVFRGYCFFNLISSCKNQSHCRYPHIMPDPTEITLILVRLSEDLFVQEYMWLRNWPGLRRTYGMCFVEECKRRDLTRILVEMTIDFHMKANDHSRDDAQLRVLVAECTLLYLNAVDLAPCEDLLLFKLKQGELLCDFYMKTIAESQNFSRFKPVFINLSKFIVNHGRTFRLKVATHILERVCILPCELPLAVALLDIVNNTDRAIFDNSKIGMFEKQLAVLNKDLYEQFLTLKNNASLNRLVLRDNMEVSPRMNTEVEPLINTAVVQTDRERRYTSPDTTKLDNMNKGATDETIFTRTIDFSRLKQFNPNSSCTVLNKNPEDKNQASTPQPNYQAWKGQSLFDKIRDMAPKPFPRPPLLKRRIHQQPSLFGPGPSKFTRWSGSDLF